MSESGSAASEEEEELDDMALGIKTKARSPRASPRRRSSSARQPKSTDAGRISSGEGNAKGSGAANRGTRPQAGSSAQSDSSSDSSGSDSSSMRSSSEGCVGTARESSVAGPTGRGKAAATNSAVTSGPVRSKVQTKGVSGKHEIERGTREHTDGPRVAVKKEEGDGAKERGQGRGKAGQRGGDGEAQLSHKPPEVSARAAMSARRCQLEGLSKVGWR